MHTAASQLGCDSRILSLLDLGRWMSLPPVSVTILVYVVRCVTMFALEEARASFDIRAAACVGVQNALKIQDSIKAFVLSSVDGESAHRPSRNACIFSSPVSRARSSRTGSSLCLPVDRCPSPGFPTPSGVPPSPKSQATMCRLP